MKVENMLKIKEEFDYKSLSRKLEIQVDMIIAQSERQNKSLQDEIERLNLEAEKRISEVERNFADALEKERRKYQMDYMEAVKKLEEKLVSNQTQDHVGMVNGKGGREEVSELQELLQKEKHLRKDAEKEIDNLKSQLTIFRQSEAVGSAETVRVHQILEEEIQHKKKLEEEIVVLRSQLLQLNYEAEQMRSYFDRAGPANEYSSADSSMSSVRHSYPRDVGNGPKAPVSLFEQVA